MRRAVAVAPGAASLLIVFALLVVPAMLTPASATTAPLVDDDPEAINALHRAALGGASVAFAGTRLVATWPGGQAQMTDVVQRPGGARSERLRTAASSASTLPGPAVGSPSPQTGAGARAVALAVLAENYSLRSGGSAVVAGNVATIVEILAADVQSGGIQKGGHRRLARLWIDRRHGVVLRQECFDRRGELALMSAFLDISYTPVLAPLQQRGTRPAAAAAVGSAAVLTEPSAATATWSVALCAAVRRNGYPCPTHLPGGLRLVDVRWSQPGSTAPAVHLTYTDGLSGVSVFVQQGRLGDSALSGQGWARRSWGSASVTVADSAPTRVVWQGGNHVFTIVAQVPPGDLRGVVAALPHRAPDTGLTAELAQAVREVADRLSGR